MANENRKNFKEKVLSPIALFIVFSAVLFFASSWVRAEEVPSTIYRCGNTYSDKQCGPDSVEMDYGPYASSINVVRAPAVQLIAIPVYPVETPQSLPAHDVYHRPHQVAWGAPRGFYGYPNRYRILPTGDRTVGRVVGPAFYPYSFQRGGRTLRNHK